MPGCSLWARTAWGYPDSYWDLSWIHSADQSRLFRHSSWILLNFGELGLDRTVTLSYAWSPEESKMDFGSLCLIVVLMTVLWTSKAQRDAWVLIPSWQRMMEKEVPLLLLDTGPICNCLYLLRSISDPGMLTAFLSAILSCSKGLCSGSQWSSCSLSSFCMLDTGLTKS